MGVEGCREGGLYLQQVIESSEELAVELGPLSEVVLLGRLCRDHTFSRKRLATPSAKTLL